MWQNQTKRFCTYSCKHYVLENIEITTVFVFSFIPQKLENIFSKNKQQNDNK